MEVVSSAPQAPVIPRSTLRGLYGAVWQHAAGVRGLYITSMVLLTLSQVVKLVIPWLAAQAINTLQATGGGSLQQAGLYVGGILLAFAIAWCLHGPGRILERTVGLHVRASLSDSLYARLSNLPLSWHEARHSGEIQQRAAQASGALYDFSQNQFIYLQNFVNLIGPVVALDRKSVV